MTVSQVHSFPRLLDRAFRLLRPGGLLLLFDYDLLPILADETTPLAAQAWHDAFSRSMQRGGMHLFSLEKVLPALQGRRIEGKDMRVPIGHGDGQSPSSAERLGLSQSLPLMLMLAGREDGSIGQNTLHQYQGVPRVGEARHGRPWGLYRCRGGRPV